jgi:hypothetical protein
MRQGQAAETERADAEEFAAGMTRTPVEDRKHVGILRGRSM